MRHAEYTGEVLEDGHLSLPEAVRKQLNLQPAELVQVVISVPENRKTAAEDAWNLFRAMGQNAVSGRLKNASTEHDRYLYSSERP